MVDIHGSILKINVC